jgi:hypothetical protein
MALFEDAPAATRAGIARAGTGIGRLQACLDLHNLRWGTILEQQGAHDPHWPVYMSEELAVART